MSLGGVFRLEARLRMVALLLLALLGWSREASAQVHHFKVYGLDSGLPAAQVFTVHQDERHYLYFGTPGGLARYDGANMRVFSVEDGLLHDSVRSIAAFEGSLWLAGEKGASELRDGRVVRTLTSEQGLGEGIVWRVVVHGGALWFGTYSGGLSRWDGHKVTTYDTAAGLPSNNVFALHSDGDTLWIGTRGGGLAKLQGGKISTVPELAAKQVMAITSVNGVLWVGARDGGIFRREGNTFRQVVADVPVYCVGRRDAEIFWGTLGQGVVRIYSDGTVQRLGRSNGMGGDRVYSVFVDHEGTVWFTTETGVSKLLSDAFQSYAVGENILSAARFAGAMWVGSLGKGVGRIDQEGTVRWLSTDDGLPNENVWSLKVDDDRLWVGTGAGLASWDGERLETQVIAGLDPGPLYDLLPDGDSLWLLGAGGACHWKRGAESCRAYTSSSGLGRASHIYQGARYGEAICFASEGGINCLEGERFRLFGPADGLPSETVYALMVDSAGTMWAGTNRGLAKRVGDRFETIGVDQGLPSNFVGALAEMRPGLLTVGSNRGVTLLEGGKVVGQLDRAHGLIGNETNFHSVLVADGDLWVGTTSGITEYQPSLARDNPEPPRVELVSWSAGGRQQVSSDEVVLEPALNNLIFDFVGLSFRDEADVRYSFQLEGYDADWSSPADTRRVRYTNLSPGRYRFLVRARNGDQVWSEPVALASFGIQAPFWQTWWFRTLAGLGVLGLAWAAYLWRVRVVEQRNVELERLVAERTEQLEQANELLRDLSLTDPLTQLHNRRFLKEVIVGEVARAKRVHHDVAEGRDSSVGIGNIGFVLVDIDHFKEINDTRGHDAGDEVLKGIAATIRDAVRESDAVIRWGGEEFLAVCHDVDRPSIADVAQRVAELVRAQSFTMPDGSDLGRTCSVGYSLFPFSVADPERFDYEEVIGWADRAMYVAKHSGRDKVVGLIGTAKPWTPADKQRARESLAAVVDEGLVRVLSPEDPERLVLTEGKG